MLRPGVDGEIGTKGGSFASGGQVSILHTEAGFSRLADCPIENQRTCNINGGIGADYRADEKRKRKTAVHFSAEKEQDQEHHKYRSIRDNRPAQGLVDTPVHDRCEIIASVDLQVFPYAIEHNDSVIDGETDDGQESSNHALGHFEIEVRGKSVEERAHAERYEDIVKQRNDAHETVDELESESDVDHDDEEGGDDGIHRILAQLMSDARPDFVFLQHFESIIGKSILECRANSIGNGHPGGLFGRSDEDITIAAEGLDFALSESDFLKGTSNVSYPDWLLKFQDKLRTSKEIDPQCYSFDEDGEEANGERGQGNEVPDSPFSHEINICLVKESHSILFAPSCLSRNESLLRLAPS